MNVLVTGGSGFFGSILKEYLANKGIDVINFDILPDSDKIDRVKAVQGDIINEDEVDACFKKYGFFDCVCHVAAQLAHGVKDKQYLWASNVRGTEVIIKNAIKYKVPKLIFTSSNCLWGQPFNRPVLESDPPNPIEIYGKSKWEAEKILFAYKDYIDSIIIRCPTIISAGRLGLLAILYEFINENKNIYVVGKGDNKYQFIYSLDLCKSILKSFEINKTDLYNIGSDNVKTFREIYQYVIDKTGSSSKIVSLPKKTTSIAMMICYKLNISPLGPYQYKMISENFVFDTKKIKKELRWEPSLTNEEMLYEAYKFYKENLNTIRTSSNLSAHKREAKMGIINLFKWLS